MILPHNFLARALRRVARAVDTSSGQPVDVTNESVNWVLFANAGMIHHGNLHCFDYAIQNLPSLDPIIEIGAFCGLSTNLLGYYKRKYGAKNLIINCDPWDFERTGPSSGEFLPEFTVRFEEYRKFVKESYIRNVRLFSQDDLPRTVESFSNDFFEAWRRRQAVPNVLGGTIQLGGPISFCYVDGNHSEEFARKDFENTDEFLVPGGLILFDDSGSDLPFEGVQRVVAEVAASGRYELIVANPNHLFRKRT